jgi:hypothetical protein
VARGDNDDEDDGDDDDISRDVVNEASNEDVDTAAL